jgi:hypothetical protein
MKVWQSEVPKPPSFGDKLPVILRRVTGVHLAV